MKTIIATTIASSMLLSASQRQVVSEQLLSSQSVERQLERQPYGLMSIEEDFI